MSAVSASAFLTQNRAKCCPFFWGSFFCSLDSLNFDSRQADMLRIFRQIIIFSSRSIVSYLSNSGRKSCSYFLCSFRPFDFRHFGYQTGGNAAHFCDRASQAMRFQMHLCKTRKQMPTVPLQKKCHLNLAAWVQTRRNAILLNKVKEE